jgi:hypothetical protein
MSTYQLDPHLKAFDALCQRASGEELAELDRRVLQEEDVREAAVSKES